MNTKVAIGLVAAILILVGLFFILHKPVAPAAFMPPTATSTLPLATSTLVQTTTTAPSAGVATKPTVTTSAPKVVHTAAFDISALSSTSAHPLVTGTANVKMVGIVLDDPSGVGIAGSSEIPVENGHWSFAVPQALTSGIYKLHLIGGDTIVTARLIVTVE